MNVLSSCELILPLFPGLRKTTKQTKQKLKTRKSPLLFEGRHCERILASLDNMQFLLI